MNYLGIKSRCFTNIINFENHIVLVITDFQNYKTFRLRESIDLRSLFDSENEPVSDFFVYIFGGLC